ncbi:MAG: hypothetical protein ACXV5Q_00605 [Frankiaceae bacterium]
MTLGTALKWTSILSVLALLLTLIVMSLATMVSASAHTVRCDRMTSYYGASSPQARNACG